MKRIMTARIGGHYVIVPKLLGLLLVLVALLLFVGATADLFVSWDKIKDVKDCLMSTASKGDEMGYLVCTVKAASIGVYPFGEKIDHLDVWAIMSQKAAVWVFWVLLLVIALVIYQSGKLIELEEEIMETTIPETPEKKEKKEEKEEKKTTRKRARRSKKK